MLNVVSGKEPIKFVIKYIINQVLKAHVNLFIFVPKMNNELQHEIKWGLTFF